MNKFKYIKIFITLFLLAGNYNLNTKGLNAPQKIDIHKKSKVKNTDLFNNFIFSKNYFIKIGETLSKFQKVSSNEPVNKLSKDAIEKMLNYKFALLKTQKKKWYEKYFNVLANLPKLNVYILPYIDKALLFFFYSNKLYSLKLREEIVTFNDFNYILNIVQKKFQGKVSKTKYGYMFKVKINKNIILEYSYYTLDNSSELTIYNVKYVRTIERLIKKKMYSK